MSATSSRTTIQCRYSMIYAAGHTQVQVHRTCEGPTEREKSCRLGKQTAQQTGTPIATQIEALQDELQRSEEQENSLVRIKDLYKDEIKKLIEKNEIHTK
jgi:2-methylcitrate dehydratase PrpD